MEEGCVTFFFPLVCTSSALLRLKSYSSAVTFLNSSLAVDFFFLVCFAEKFLTLLFGFISSGETADLCVRFIPASFWN